MLAYSFVGDSGAGKTTLLARVIAILTARGVDVRAVKHSKGFDDPDPPGKDSRRLREAGARRVVLASPARTAVVWDHVNLEPGLDERLRLAGDGDLVLVESWGAAGLPVVEVLRAALPRRVPRSDPADPRWIAVVSDFEPPAPARVRRFRLEDVEALADFLWPRIGGVAAYDSAVPPIVSPP
jgi:molybdopterin-guanine dinucleotide biosynthesis protein MobB